MTIENKEGSIEKRYGAYCAYCGWKAESVYYMQLEGSSIARDHAKTCEKHPLRQLERELAEARSALSNERCDAARYRKMRDHSGNVRWWMLSAIDLQLETMSEPAAADVDAAVDAMPEGPK